MKKLSTKNFRLPEMLLIGALALALGIVVVSNINDNRLRDRDAQRLSDINSIRTALNQYFDDYGSFPACIYKMQGCASLEGTQEMELVPRDPLTALAYSYAAIGTGENCRTYHIGASLERTESQALLTGSDAPPEAASELCTGSEPDFSGLSFAQGGEPCSATAGIAQPTNSKQGETCFDLKPRRR